MKRVTVVITILIFTGVANAQTTFNYTEETVIYLSKADSAVMTYSYPQLHNLQNKNYEERVNTQIQTMLLPDPSVLEKLEKITAQKAALLKNKSHQDIHVSITYMNALILCLRTKISETIPGVYGNPGDMYYNTFSIASGNEYYLNNLFNQAIYDTIFEQNKVALMHKAADDEDFNLKEHLVGFGLIGEELCANCITLEVIVNTLYGPEGPMPLEIKSDDLIPLINPDGPLKDLLKK
jgi:hypothetical protein